MFRKPGSEDTSSVSSMSGISSHEESTEDANKSREIQTAVQSSSLIPVLEPLQHLTVHYLSYIEKECRENALKAINKKRSPEQYLPEDHPDVDILCEKLYQQVVQGFRKNGVPVGEYADQSGSHLRNHYRQNFQAALLNAASKAIGVAEDPDQINLDVLPFAAKMAAQSGHDMLLKEMDRQPGSPSYSNDYKEIILLGKGGFGKVYHVKNPLDGQEYAIKQISIGPSKFEKLVRNGKHLRTLLVELKTLASLHHPNVVRYFHSWVEKQIIKRASHNDMQDYLDDAEYSDEDLSTANHLGVSTATDQGPISENLLDTGGITFGNSSRSSTRNVENDQDEDENESKDEDEDEDIDGEVNRDIAPHSLATSQELTNIAPISSGCTIFIKMAVHQFTLSDYIFPKENPTGAVQCPVRCCFHKVPAAKMCLAILNGIDYLHSRSIVHRDLKPANVLLSIDERKPSFHTGFVEITACPECPGNKNRKPIYVTPHICDFGLAAKLDELDVVDHQDVGSGLTREADKSPVGTKFYRPAKMPSKDPKICPKLDIYSLGVIAFELVWKFDVLMERVLVLGDLCEGKFPEAFETHEMAAGIKNMLCADRDQRWNAEETRAWLEGLLGPE